VPARRAWALGGGIALVAALIAACWVQLQPAQQTSRQTARLLAETRALWPTILRRRVGFYVQNLPDKYQGSYVFRNGFAEGLTVFGGQSAWVTPTLALDPAALSGPLGDQAGLANLGIRFDPATALYHVDALAAVTIAQPPPPGPAWDFRRCDPAALAAWQPPTGDWRCTPIGDQSYATLDSANPILTLNRPIVAAPGDWVRLAVCLRRPAATPATAQWTWSGGSVPPFPLASSPDWRVYWTYIPARALDSTLPQARLTLPADLVDVQWLAVTPISLPESR
jgi:hypothetical protein